MTEIYDLWLESFAKRKHCSQQLARKLYPSLNHLFFPDNDSELVSEEDKNLTLFNQSFIGDLSSSFYRGKDWWVPYTTPSTWGLFDSQIAATTSPYELPSLHVKGDSTLTRDNYGSWVEDHLRTLKFILNGNSDLSVAMFVISRLAEPLADGFYEFAKRAIPLSFIEFPLGGDYPQCLEKKPRAEFTKLLTRLSRLRTRMARVYSDGNIRWYDNNSWEYRDWNAIKQLVLEKWKYTKADLRSLFTDLDLAYHSDQLHIMEITEEDGSLVGINFCRCDFDRKEVEDLHLLKMVSLQERLSDYAIVKNVQLLNSIFVDAQEWSYVLDDTMEPTSYPESPALRYKHKFLPKGISPNKRRRFGVSFILHRDKTMKDKNRELITSAIPTFFNIPSYEHILSEVTV